MKKSRNENFLIFFLIVIFLLLIKIDFRFQDTVFCCGDDHDYYIHAETIALDFDLDYKNQLSGFEDKRFNKNNKIAPIGFVGTGLLSAPFLFFGNILDSVFSNPDLISYKLLIYSFSSIFYLGASIILTIKVLLLLNISFKPFHVLFFIFGSGISYYAFERYSMTHVYENFTIIFLFYVSIQYFQSGKTTYAALIPISLLLVFLVKWTNYFGILIPIIAKLLVKNNYKHLLLKNIYFYISSSFSVFIFLMHTKLIYGQITFDPRFVYSSSINISNELVNNESNLVFDFLNTLKILFFSQEFGIVYFSPILFFSFILSLIFLVTNLANKTNILMTFLFMISNLSIYFIYNIWRSSGSSYGYRYLFCLISLCVVFYYFFTSNLKFMHLHKLLILLSLFSFLSTIYFETTFQTQLSLDSVTNSWGELSRYSQPEYLTGYLASFSNFESYLKIFTTSFLGAIFFKFIIQISSIDQLNNILNQAGLPVENGDFQALLNKLEQISWSRLLVVLLFSIIGVRFIFYKIKQLSI